MRSARVFPFDLYADGPELEWRGCDHAGCAAQGEFRAPRAPDRLNDYLWFCLEHVRAYNKSWNFCAGRSADEIEDLIRKDTCWDRPTRPMAGSWKVHEQRLRDAVFADFANGAFDQGAGETTKARPENTRLQTPEMKALAVLELTGAGHIDFATIKARYKDLVKLHHPDANGGSAVAEEKLKDINLALAVLKAAYDN